MAQCPKCGVERTEEAVECPGCGLIYTKYESMKEKRKQNVDSSEQGDKAQQRSNTNMAICPVCKKTVSSNIESCPQCGSHILQKTCKLCQQPATMTVKIEDKKTGAYSMPVNLCDSCIHKIEKTRKVIIIDNYCNTTSQKTEISSSLPPKSTKSFNKSNTDTTNLLSLERSSKVLYKKSKIVSIITLFLGVIMIGIGLFTSIPSNKLIDLGGSGVKFTKEATLIQKYVGGDAYNYIIGASLIGGYISGRTMQRAIFISTGILLSSMALFALCYIIDKESILSSSDDIKNKSFS